MVIFYIARLGMKVMFYSVVIRLTGGEITVDDDGGF